MALKYDLHYRDDHAACGAPFPEFVAVADEIPPGSVVDLGCGQGRDALLFARRGHSVVGVDVSAVGIEQMLLVAEGPKGMAPIRAAVESASWRVRGTQNRLIARKEGIVDTEGVCP